MTNELTLKDNSSKPYAWMFDNVDLADIDNLREWVETAARGMINGQNYSDKPDAEVYAEWLTSGELEAVLDLAESMMTESIDTENGTVAIEKTETGYRAHSPYESQSADTIEKAYKIAREMALVLTVGWENS